MNELIELPPSEAGAEKDTAADWFPATAVTPVGPPGTVGTATIVRVVVADVIVPPTAPAKPSVKVSFVA